MKYGRCSALAGLMLLPTMGVYASNISDGIYRAALSRNAAEIEAYIRSGISIDTPDADGNTALCRAHAFEQLQAYNFLLQYGADPNAPCMHKKSDAVLDNALIGTGLVATGGYGRSSGDSQRHISWQFIIVIGANLV